MPGFSREEAAQESPGHGQERVGDSLDTAEWQRREAPSQPPYYGLTVNPTPTPREGEPVKDRHISGRAVQSGCWEGGINPNCLRFLAKKSLCVLHISWHQHVGHIWHQLPAPFPRECQCCHLVQVKEKGEDPHVSLWLWHAVMHVLHYPPSHGCPAGLRYCSLWLSNVTASLSKAAKTEKLISSSSPRSW